MARLKKRMSATEHWEVARRLLSAIQEAGALGEELVRIYGTSSRIGKIAERLFMTGSRSDLQELRSRLDNAWYAEQHDRTETNPYYGGHALRGFPIPNQQPAETLH